MSIDLETRVNRVLLATRLKLLYWSKDPLNGPEEGKVEAIDISRNSTDKFTSVPRPLPSTPPPLLRSNVGRSSSVNISFHCQGWCWDMVFDLGGVGMLLMLESSCCCLDPAEICGSDKSFRKARFAGKGFPGLEGGTRKVRE